MFSTMTSNTSEHPTSTGRSRRVHEKSRYGCKNCKTRRIKCDESRPSCKNCIRRKQACDFQALHTTSSASLPKVAIARIHPSDTASELSTAVRKSPTKHLSSPMMEYLYPGQDPNARLFENHLFHYYTSRISDFPWPSCGSGAFSPSGYDLAQNIPVIAMRCDFVMETLLSFASLSLARLYPDDHGMRVATHTYMARALSKFQVALASKTQEQDGDALYITSRLIAFHALSHHLGPRQEAEPRRRVLDWLHVFRGLNVLSRHVGIGQFGFAVIDLDVGTWQYPYAHDEDLTPSLLQPFEFLLEDTESENCTDAIRSYRHIVAYLSSVYNHPALGRDQMWWFLIENRSDFLRCCKEEKSKAWLLLGVYLLFVAAMNKQRPLGLVAARDLALVKQGLKARDILLLEEARTIIRVKFEDAGLLDQEDEAVCGALDFLTPPRELGGSSLPDLSASLLRAQIGQ